MNRRRAFVGLCAAAFVAAGLMVMDVNPAVPQTVGITALRSAANHVKHGERYCSRACGVAASNKRRKAA